MSDIVKETLDAGLAKIQTMVEESKSLTGDALKNLETKIADQEKSLNDFKVKVDAAYKQFDAKDLKNYSVSKGIRDMVNGMMSGKRDKTLESEISEEIAKSIGMDSDTNGAILAPNEVLQTGVEAMERAQKPISDLVRKIDLTGMNSVMFPRQLTRPIMYATGNQTAATESGMTFDSITMTGKEHSGWVTYDKNLILRSPIGIESMIRENLLEAKNNTYESTLLKGASTSNEPCGLVNFADILEYNVGTAGQGALATLAIIDELIGKMEAVDTFYGKLAIVTSPQIAKVLRNIEDEIKRKIISRPNNKAIGEYYNLPFYTSSLVPTNIVAGDSTNCSYIALANFDKVLLGEWGGVRIEVNPWGDEWKKGQALIGIFSMFDTGLLSPNSVAICKDAKIA